MTTARAGITLGLQGAEQTATGMEQVAQRGASAFQRLRGTMETVGTGATFAEDRIKKFNRGIGDATGAVQLISTFIPGLGGSFGSLAGMIGNAADVFATLSNILLRNPLGLAAVAVTGAVVAYQAFAKETDQASASSTKLAEAVEIAQATLKELGTAAQATNEEKLAKLRDALSENQGEASQLAAKIADLRDKLKAAQDPAGGLDQALAALNWLRNASEAKRYADELSKLEPQMKAITTAAGLLTNQIAKINFDKAVQGLEAFLDLDPKVGIQRKFQDANAGIDAGIAAGLVVNEAEAERLRSLAARRRDKELEALNVKPAGGGRSSSEVDKLPEQYARLAASLDPVIARERELIEANRILEEAQSRLGVSTETITDLKARLADKAYAATEAGKADAAAVAEAQRLYDASITPMEAYTKQLEAIARALELNKIGEEQASRAREAASKQLEQANEESKASKKTARDLGLAFSSAFEDAVVGGKKLRDVIDGLGQDLLRVFIRRQLTEPLLELFSTATKGIGGSGGLFDGILGGLGKSLGAAIGGIFGGGVNAGQIVYSGPVGPFPFARGGAFAGGAEIVPFARGGALVSRPTMFPMRGGKVGLMGEAGPEAIMPLDRDASGKLGVRSRGGGGGGAPVIQISNTIDARGADKQLREQLPGILRRNSEQTIEQVSQLLDRGGAFSRKAGRRTL